MIEFVTELRLDDVPERVRRRAELLLADLAAVCVAGRRASAAGIAADHAQALHPGEQATVLLDGRRLGAVGAAFANGVLANVLDFDDGHRLTKGHPGATVISAALAAAQLADSTFDELLLAVVVGYEVAIRAGIALHARDSAYHASGAWGGVGAAAAAARLLDLDPDQTTHALSLAEYHAPIAPIMRSCAQPEMTKDACGWGAQVGLASALLAARGFTSVRGQFLADEPDERELDRRWMLEEVYVKAYPCCRWSQGAIAAALQARPGEQDAPVERVLVRTFAAADGLAKLAPKTTEEAQYSLVWPVACALRRGRFTVEDVLGPFDDEALTALAARVQVRVDPAFTAAFPERRLTALDIRLRDGRRLRVGPLEAPGEPDDPRWEQIVRSKAAQLLEPSRATLTAVNADTRLGALGAAELVGLLCPATSRAGSLV